MDTLKSLYSSLFLSYINYGSLIWASTYASYLEPLYVPQNRAHPRSPFFLSIIFSHSTLSINSMFPVLYSHILIAFYLLLFTTDVRGIYLTFFMILFLIDLYKMENTCVCLNLIKIEPNSRSLFFHDSIIKTFCS